MTWYENTVCRDTRRVIPVAAAVLLTCGAACTQQEAGEALGRTIENTTRAVCEKTGNCQNSCPDGSIAKGPFYRCR